VDLDSHYRKQGDVSIRPRAVKGKNWFSKRQKYEIVSSCENENVGWHRKDSKWFPEVKEAKRQEIRKKLLLQEKKQKEPKK